MRTHYLNTEILTALVSDDEPALRRPTMRTSERRIPARVTNQARTRRLPEFISLTGLEDTVAQPEAEPIRLPKLSVFLDRCRQLGLIGQSIAMFGGLVTTDVLADFYDQLYQSDPTLVIDRRRTADVSAFEYAAIQVELPALAGAETKEK